MTRKILDRNINGIEMELKEAYIKMQEASGIEVGDTIRVLRKAEDYEMGWGCLWTPEMDECVGKLYTVGDVTPYVGELSGEGFPISTHIGIVFFPFFVLEVVNKKPEPEFKSFDKVLVRDSENDQWLATSYSYYQKLTDSDIRPHITTHGEGYVHCIPYEGNEHLAGKCQNVSD